MSIIDMAADRAPFVDQSQSMNLFLANPTNGQVTSMLFYSWKRGLKTILYYLRTQAAAAPTKVTVDVKTMNQANQAADQLVCVRGDPTCDSCSG